MSSYRSITDLRQKHVEYYFYSITHDLFLYDRIEHEFETLLQERMWRIESMTLLCVYMYATETDGIHMMPLRGVHPYPIFHMLGENKKEKKKNKTKRISHEHSHSHTHSVSNLVEIWVHESLHRANCELFSCMLPTRHGEYIFSAICV